MRTLRKVLARLRPAKLAAEQFAGCPARIDYEGAGVSVRCDQKAAHSGPHTGGGYSWAA